VQNQSQGTRPALMRNHRCVPQRWLQLRRGLGGWRHAGAGAVCVCQRRVVQWSLACESLRGARRLHLPRWQAIRGALFGDGQWLWCSREQAGCFWWRASPQQLWSSSL